MNIKTIGQLRKYTNHLTDDFQIEFIVRKPYTDEEIKAIGGSCIWNPYHTQNVILEFDDIGYSDKVLCLSCEIK